MATIIVKGRENIREYIMEMSNLVAKLKSFKLELGEDLIMHLVLISLWSQSLNIFKSFKVEVELQLGKTTKTVKFDRGGEYYGRYDGSGEQRPGPFTPFLKECAIVLQYTMSGKPNMNAKVRPYRPHERKLDSRIVNCYFVGYAECSRGYKFYDPTSRFFFETGNVRILEDVEFGKEENNRNVVFEEESVNDIDYDEALPQTPIGQLQQPQEVSLRRFIKERRHAISVDYIVFLQEHDDDIGLTEDDPINFCQAMQSSISQKWIDAMKDELKSM
ncbi:hypothetical protein CR513_17283, partial [Mucuna pruriens]